jgi:hypothetical protein
VRAVQPALTNFYNGLSDEQKARFNTLGSTRLGALGSADASFAIGIASMAMSSSSGFEQWVYGAGRPCERSFRPPALSDLLSLVPRWVNLDHGRLLSSVTRMSFVQFRVGVFRPNGCRNFHFDWIGALHSHGHRCKHQLRIDSMTRFTCSNPRGLS